MHDQPRKGILLAGGCGTRLYPLTRVVNKHLLPVFNKPVIYYSLSILLLAGIREIMLLTTERDLKAFQELLGEGEPWGVQITYAVQKRPGGIAEALLIAEEFLQGSPCALILGDNLFFGASLEASLARAKVRTRGATLFCRRGDGTNRYGVLEVDAQGKPLSIQEKPQVPRGDSIITGLYFYDETAPKKARGLKRSARGELEISDLNQVYLDEQMLHVESLSSQDLWLDIGTPHSLLEAQQRVFELESRGEVVGCPWAHARRSGLLGPALDEQGSDLEELSALGGSSVPFNERLVHAVSRN